MAHHVADLELQFSADLKLIFAGEISDSVLVLGHYFRIL